LRGGDVMGGRYRELHRRVREISEKLTADRPLFEDIARVCEWLKSAEVQAHFLPPRPSPLD
jgi:histidine ammonia-lyase